VSVDFVSALRARASALGAPIALAQARDFETFYALLAKWNRRINLTALDVGPTAPLATLDRLFIEPLIASDLIPAIPLGVIDLGSGAGSPAIPLRILRPSIRLMMVETKARKAAFLREAVRTLGFRDVDVEQTRFQSLPASLSSEFDIVTVRALRLDDELLATALELLKPTGQLITFGADEAAGFRLADTRQLPGGSRVASWIPSEDIFQT
jgi:16S rRNA (guanine527-N7)-methyltransferase